MHAHKEHGTTSVFEARGVMLRGEGMLTKGNHSSHVAHINEKTATISFGSPVHQAKENRVIHTVNTSYLLPQNNVWIPCFKHFFSMRIVESFYSHFNYLCIFNCPIKFLCKGFFFVFSFFLQHHTTYYYGKFLEAGAWLCLLVLFQTQAHLSELSR